LLILCEKSEEILIFWFNNCAFSKFFCETRILFVDDDESIRLSSRVLSNSGGHIEVCSDIDDQGIFLIRDDLVKWIMRNVEGKHWCSIREDLVPALLKNKYRGKLNFVQDILTPSHPKRHSETLGDYYGKSKSACNFTAL
jgi:hypothetical protein